MACPFYAMHDTGRGLKRSVTASGGNQCAVVRTRFSPCRMEIFGLPVEWKICLLRRQHPPPWAGIVRCVGCGADCRRDSDCDVIAESLCPDCFDRAERLAAEAAGQQRLS